MGDHQYQLFEQFSNKNDPHSNELISHTKEFIEHAIDNNINQNYNYVYGKTKYL